MSKIPRSRPPARMVLRGEQEQNAGRRGPRSTPAPPDQPLDARSRLSADLPPNAPPRRDPFPYLMGGVIGALIIGLMAVAYLLGTSARPGTGDGVPNPVTSGGGTTQPPASQPAPRISMEEFRALYDDPARRPLVIDVRSKQAYDEAHIAGAVSFPEAEVDARVAELPKDRLIVAYCQ